ncbi:efflux RND transporter periplasmic adaptor subunit [Abyssalbus ytuae]|uniref:Efflux RND transporter periplasmic adaptor subunit n=1 Tax=Abyssalbus ytuae TaxID=2926907 RepID=A0A9E7D2Y7_9FLAO|nr:efflux RND transporter periplasmic adaptor subunit [Abyssalbus ytuae]UOB18683.1 efflux RND transporter periplasmic adaptor subunit [Abyssalbus ytuae]
MRNVILSVLGGALILGSIFLGKYIIDSKKKPQVVIPKLVKTVFVDTVNNGNVAIVIETNGNLTAKNRIELYSEVQGIFRRGSKPFKPGQNFSKGQTLLRIDASEYYASVQSQKSNLYNLIAATMPDLRLDFPDIYNKWQTYLNNFDINKTTPQLPEMSSEKERFFITGRNIISTYYTVKNLEQRLSKYTLSAPFSGVLTEALVTEGTLIRNGQKLGEFIDPSVYEMEVTVNKSYGTFLKVGEEVELKNLDNTQVWKGKIIRINGSVNQQTQTVSAFIEVKSDDLKEGTYLEAFLKARNEPESFEISRKLLLDNNEIFVVKDSILDIIPVKPVFFSDNTAVVKGIPNGTVILSRPVPGSYAGMLVKIYNENRTANN